MIVQNENHLQGAIKPEDIVAMHDAVNIGDTISVRTKTGKYLKGKVVYKTAYFALVQTKGGALDSRLWVDMIITERARMKE